MLLLFSFIACGQELKVFGTLGLHEQSEQMFGSQVAYHIGAMFGNDLGIRAAYSDAIDINFSELNLKAYYRFYQDDVFKAYVNAGAAYETTNGSIAPAFGVDLTFRTGPLVDIITSWSPTANGKFRSDKGWTNHVSGGVLFKL